MVDTAELRRLAEEAAEFKKLSDATPDNTSLKHAYSKRVAALASFVWANVPAFIEFLDRLDAAEKVCKAAYELTKSMEKPFFDDDGMMATDVDKKHLRETRLAILEWQEVSK